MTARETTFWFNTVLLAYNSSVDSWDSDAKKIRAHIMSQPTSDGITDIKTDRYSMLVSWVTEVTTLERVIGIVTEAIAWAAGQKGFFPYRADKTPSATADIPVDSDGRHLAVVDALLNTDLYAPPFGESEQQEMSVDLHKTLTRHEGVRMLTFSPRRLSLHFDPAATTARRVEDHLDKMILDVLLARRGCKFFPYLQPGEKPHITYTSRQSERYVS